MYNIDDFISMLSGLVVSSENLEAVNDGFQYINFYVKKINNRYDLSRIEYGIKDISGIVSDGFSVNLLVYFKVVDEVFLNAHIRKLLKAIN